MNERDRELEAFSKFIGALEPWLCEVVLIGGWAHRLYRRHPLARRLAYLPLITLDGDVAVPPKLKARELSVRKRLLDAGFVEEFVGEDWPPATPATHYHYGKGGGFYAEFLSPLVGSEYDRRGKRKATQEVGGISSQLLRYIEILMISPWKVQLGRENGYPFSPKRKVQIARLTELFGGLALVLACVGVYGVTAYSVERRTNEIGIRMALGADRRNVLSLVLRAALTQIGLGLVIGVPAALAGSRVLASQLWGVKSYDPMIIAIAALVLAVCAIFAASLPARRATRVDPMVALRYEFRASATDT